MLTEGSSLFWEAETLRNFATQPFTLECPLLKHNQRKAKLTPSARRPTEVVGELGIDEIEEQVEFGQLQFDEVLVHLEVLLLKAEKTKG